MKGLDNIEKTLIGYHLLAIDMASTADEKTAKAEELFDTIARWMSDSRASGFYEGELKGIEKVRKIYNDGTD